MSSFKFDRKVTGALFQDILAAQQNLVQAMSRLEIPANLPKAQLAKTQADDTVRQVEDYLKTRDGLAAFNKIEEAVEALRHLADTLPEAQPAPVSPKESPEQMAARNKARQAQDLAREQKNLQEAVRKAFEETLNSPPAPADADRAPFDDKHQALAREIAKLADDLMKLVRKTDEPESMPSAREAAQAALDAAKAAALKKDPLDAAKEVSSKLDLAGQKAEQAAAKMQADGKSAGENAAMKMTGTAVRESQQEVANSRKQLGEGPSPQAEQAMQQAAKALQNAAQAALQQMEASASSQGSSQSLTSDQAGARGGGQLTSRWLSKELEKYPGKSWGQLPGELRGIALIQDLHARYGDDYAPIIQRYFQQLADVPAKER